MGVHCGLGILISWNNISWCNNSGFATYGCLRLVCPMSVRSYSVCIATNCSQVKQKFSLTGKLSGKWRGDAFAWAVIKNWLNHQCLQLKTVHFNCDLSGIFVCLGFITVITCSVDQVVHYFLLSFFFFLEI